MGFDITKSYRTRAGAQAEIIRGPDGKYYGWMQTPHGILSQWWYADGKIREGDGPNSLDLINIPQTRTVKVWMNIYEPKSGGFSNLWFSRADADQNYAGKRIACIEREITYTLGEGL